MQFTVLFPCLVVALSLTFLPGKVSAVTCNAGQIQCANNTQCDATDNCECQAGFNGNGRVHCAPFRCVCTAYADPRYTIFDTPPSQLMLKVNLPCSVDLVTTSSLIFFSNSDGSLCILNYITAHPEVRPGSGPPFRTFVNQVTVSATRLPSTLITAEVGKRSNSISPASAGTVTIAADGFTRIAISQCAGLEVGYRATYGGAYVALPENQTSAGLDGVCGNCDGTSEENVGNTTLKSLNYFFSHIAPPSRQVGDFMSQCQSISSSIMNDCTDAESLNAARTCGLYVDSFGRCLLDDPTSAISTQDSLMDAIVTCVTQACAGSSMAALCGLLSTQATTSCTLPACPSW